jgi:hypothetical protein
VEGAGAGADDVFERLQLGLLMTDGVFEGRDLVSDLYCIITITIILDAVPHAHSPGSSDGEGDRNDDRDDERSRGATRGVVGRDAIAEEIRRGSLQVLLPHYGP